VEVISLDVFTQWLNHLCLLIATYSWILLWLEIAVVFLSVGYLQCFDTLCCVMGRASDLRNLLHLSQRFHSVLGNNSRKEDSWIKLLTSKMPWWRCRSIKCVVIRRSWLHKSFNGNNKWWRFKYYNQTLGWKAAVQFPSGVHGRWKKDEVRPLVRSVICVPFSALTLMVGWQEGHLAHKNPIPLIPEVLYQSTWGRRTRGATSWPRLTWKNDG